MSSRTARCGRRPSDPTAIGGAPAVGDPSSSLHVPGADTRRGDLQGLRAVAVLAVIAYHFGIPGAPGGFVGVDIFFVLSGFFITRLLVRDVEAHGRVRLVRFWANRAKRLLPNGLLTILCVLVASVVLLPSYRLPGISEDAVSAAAFFANFHFEDRAVDYFHLDDPPSPLLHYWSLAVEEQFYLALPLLIGCVVVLLRFRRLEARTVVLLLLVLVAAVSLAASLVAIERSQPEAFFFPHYRAWQLALGGMAGLLFDRRAAVPRAIRAGGAAAGMLAIAASIALLGDDMTYPGIRALAPTVGAAALVFGVDAGRFLAYALSRPLLVRIGDMSYSLYLWHWPVAVFLAALSPVPGAGGIVAGLALTALLAWGAWRYVERPIHHMPLSALRPSRLLVAGAGGVAVAVCASIGAGSLQGRSDPRITALIAEATADLGANYKNGCHLGLDPVDQPKCRFGQPGGHRVVLFGDSHAAQWFTPVAKAGEEAGWQVEAWTKTSCPTADVAMWYPRTRSVYEQCDRWRKARLRDLVENPPDLVILGNFANYYGWIFDDLRGRSADRPTSERLWRDGMQRTGEALVAAGIPVVELRDTPRMYASYKDCLSGGRWQDCGRQRRDALSGMASPRIDSALYSRLDLSDHLCSPQECPAAIDGAIAYRDSEHLTASHAAALYRHFLPLLAKAERPE